MTTEEALKRRADRLAWCQARAAGLGCSVVETPTGGFALLSRGQFMDDAVELGLPDVEKDLDALESLQNEATP